MIDSSTILIDDRYEAFHPSRFECSFGLVVDYTDSGFNIVWTEVTEGCLSLTTTSKFGSKSKTGQYVVVHPIDSMSIYSDKGDFESATICTGENIIVTLDAKYEVEPKWEVNGSIYYGFENTMSFDQPGEYTILISHQEAEECNCTPDAYYTIIVNSGDSPSIDCKRTVCAGEATTYYSGTECDSYIWEVGSGGVILDGGEIGDSYVTVEWTSGPTDEITLSTPSCFETVCSETIVETVNIINSSINIQGLDLVCVGDIASYVAPNYTGTDFDWVVSPHGEIINGQGTNRIQIRWNSANDPSLGKVALIYNNCNINCDGFAELDVSVLPKLMITQSSDNLCLDTEYTFNNNLGIVGNWNLIDPNGIESNYSSLNTLQLSLTEAGEYTLELINSISNSCNDIAIHHFEVLEDILPVAIIDGPQLICVGQLVKYTVPGLSNLETASWEVIDGSGPPLDLGSSRSLLYTWIGAGPYQITVTTINNLTGCESESSIFVFDNDISLNGFSDLCLGEEAVYELPEYYGYGVDWSIEPPSAGTIIEANEEWARIIWSKVGEHQVIASYCGLTLDTDITIRPYPTATLTYDDIVCFDELATLDVNTDATNSVEIYNESNTLISSSTNANIPAGIYNIDISSQFGCTTTEEITIEETEDYEIQISTLRSKAVCPPFSAFEIFAVDVSSNYTYQWYHDNMPVGVNSPSYFVSEIGAYYLVVTDENGCKATSNVLEIFICCVSGNSPNIPPVDMEVTEIDCNVRDFEILAPYQSTNFIWRFGDPFSGSNSATGFAVNHTYSRAGRYSVEAIGNALCETFEVDVCGNIMNTTVCEGTSTLVDIPLVANFSFDVFCDTEPVVFIDETTKLPSIGTVNYEWDFGDPTSLDNTSSSPTPSHIFSSAGTYTVTLNVTEVGGCTSTKIKTVFIEKNPIAPITSQTEYCIGVRASFKSNTTGEDLDYAWDFGDPGSGIKNNASDINVEHIFSSFGTFTVELTVTDSRGCSSSVTKRVDLVDNQMQGNITSDILIPKCPYDIATLSAPLVGEIYLWSTGETTPSIEVTDESEYKVTITNAIGCIFFPTPFQVYNYDIADTRIYSFKESEIVYDSIDVCLGDNFDLYATEYPNAIYEWSPVLDENSYLDYYEHFQSLMPGRYSYDVTVTDPVSGCVIQDGPFIVNIHEALEEPVIFSANGDYCENSTITLSVTPYDPSLNYEWNNGQSGESITVYSSGEYDVTVTNDIGCIEVSDEFKVRPIPGVNEWMTGCIEVCFPKEFCLNLNENNDYELIHNGINIGPITNDLNTSGLDLDEPGDYELLVTNEYGCQSISDILTLTASPKDQTLSGIVYLDENENLIFDSNDILQDEVVVYLMNGNTIIDSMVTDENGFYDFDPVYQSNLRVLLSLESIDFVFEGVSDSTLIYYECAEDKEVNFPLIFTCAFPVKVDTFYTCPDEPILINGTNYYANETDTIILNLYEFCDSTYIVNVRPFEEPEVVLDISPSCSSHPSGELNIKSLSGGVLEYSLNPDFSTIDSMYSDLDTGTFMLYVRNENECTYSYPFTIENIEEPVFTLSSISTCQDIGGGELEIEIISGGNVLFSLHPDSIFTDVLTYSELNDGVYEVFARDSLGCIYSDIIEIESFQTPEISIVNEPICGGDEDGSINIEVLQGSPQFSIDNLLDYSYDTVWSSLSPGTHVLYFLSQYECLDSLEFNIDTIPSPVVEILTVDACENIELGSASFSSANENLTYSLDGISFSDQRDFEDLDAGNYMLHTMTEEGCIYQYPFDIAQFVEPIFTFTVSNSCSNIINGAIEITSQNSNGLMFSIDSIEYSENTIFENLEHRDYTLYVRSSEHGCEYLFPFSIEELPAPEIIIIEHNTCEGSNNGMIDIQVVSGSSLTFDINSDGTFSEETHFEDLMDGDYIITVQDDQGCEYEYLANILTIPDPEFIVSTINSCDQIANGSLSISSDNNDIKTSINDSSFESIVTYSSLENGIYKVAIMDSNQCSNVQFVEILANPPLETSFDGYDLDCYDKEVEVIPAVTSHFGELQYSWNTEDTSESILVRESGIYEVTISDFCDEQYLSTNIQISFFDNENPFHVANIFSPNSDDINDCFQAVIDPTFTIITYDLKVFDRWGNLHFNTDNIEDCWDGRFQNRDVVPGVYVYIVDMTIDHCDGAKQVKKAGDVTVLR